MPEGAAQKFGLNGQDLAVEADATGETHMDQAVVQRKFGGQNFPFPAENSGPGADRQKFRVAFNVGDQIEKEARRMAALPPQVNVRHAP